MAAVAKQTYVVQNMGQGIEGKIVVTLNEEVETDGITYAPAGSLTLSVDVKDAGKYVPGTRFTMTLTEV